jgi:hypothetical protein
MRRALRSLKNFFAKFRRQEPRPLYGVTDAPDWMPEHRAAWQAFLNSPAGVVLMHRGRAIQFHNSTAACKDVFHTSHSAGTAHGFGECLDWLVGLSRTSRAPEVANPQGEENAGTDTTRPEGETALRELMSP